MFPFFIKLVIYSNLCLITLISIYIIFSKSKENEIGLEENFSKTYFLKKRNIQ